MTRLRFGKDPTGPQIPKGYPRDTQGIPKGCPRDT
jgi:hypothetical protein